MRFHHSTLLDRVADVERDEVPVNLSADGGECNLQIRMRLDLLLQGAQERVGALPKFLHRWRVSASALDSVRHDDDSELELDSTPVHGVPPSG